MPRRRELKGVADGVLGSFVSRNNDIDGYWALGKLLSYALKRKEREAVIDLLAGELRPPSVRFARMAAHYGEMLRRHVLSRRLSAGYVADAIVEVRFGPADPTDRASPWPGDLQAFTCRLVIADDRGGTHEASRSGWCRPHSPWHEWKSTRG